MSSPLTGTRSPSSWIPRASCDWSGTFYCGRSTDYLVVNKLCHEIAGGRAFPTDSTAAVAAALSPFALDQEAHRFTRGRFCRGTVLCNSRKPRLTNSYCHCCNAGAGRDQKTLRLLILSWCCTVRSQEAELHQQSSQPLQRGDRRSARQFATEFPLETRSSARPSTEPPSAARSP